MPGHDDDEFMELLPNSEKDLDNSLYDGKSAAKHVMDQQQQKKAVNKWTLPIMAGLLFMIIVAIALAISLLNRRIAGEELPLVSQPNIVAVKPSVRPFHLHTAPEDISGSNAPWKSYRLPRNVQPTKYKIVLHPNVTTSQFEGYCQIWINVTAPTKYLIFHSLNLNITMMTVSINTSKGELEPLGMTDPFLYPKNDYVVLDMNDDVAVGSYILEIKFSGVMVEDKLSGLYRSKYQTKDGIEKHLVLTHFEPTDARSTFPCFDEPDMKAAFEMSVIHESQHKALSNMPASQTIDDENGLKRTDFQISVPMSTYLVCIVVSDFNNISNTTNDNITVRVFADNDQIKYAKYALDIAVKTLDFYTDFFGIKYPLPKLDLIAIPDFMSGAMENWGLVTFREAYVLYNPEETIDFYKKNIMLVVVHELAHMWFGNLVTMKWWNDLWLNEGFARNMEKIAGDYVNKSFREPEVFVTDNIQYVMQRDTGLHTHPIVQTVNRSADINGIFDDISYQKGASVIYMLDTVLGRENFRKGLQSYLKKYEYGNAVTSDLWDALTNASESSWNVSSMMDTWIRQEGYPVITIHQSDNNTRSWNITQERFIFSLNKSLVNDINLSAFKLMWDVPLTYTNPINGSIMIHWLHQEKQNLLEVDFPILYPLKFNVNNTGYYRINYDEETWKLFSDQLLKNHSVYTATDRSNLIEDVFSLSRGGYLNYSFAFDLAKYLKNETDYIPWISALGHLSGLFTKLEVTEVFPQFRNYFLSLITPIYESLGWSEEGDFAKRNLRASILSSACKLGLKDCLQEASRRFQEWKNGTQNITQNLKSIVYKYGIQTSYSYDDWEYVWMKYSNGNTPAQEKNILLSALASTRTPSLIFRYLEYVYDTNKVRSQDFFGSLNKLSDRVAIGILWDFVRSEWETIVQRFTVNNNHIGSMFLNLGHMFFQENQIKEYEEFISQYPDIGAGQRDRAFGLDMAKDNVEWMNHLKKDIKLWLMNNIQ